MVVVALATIAFALMTIGIKDSQVPVKASEFSVHGSCSFQGSPSLSPPLYGWHFVLPGGNATFVSLTAEFEDGGTVTLPGPQGSFVQDGKGAVIYTATDDTLTDAEAEINGTTPQGYFVLSHTCLPTSQTTSPSPSTSASSSTSPSTSPSVSATSSATTSPSTSVSATSSSTTSPSTSVSATASESPTETPSAEVSGTVITSPPTESASESVSPTVLGVKQTRAPAGLPSTGSSSRILLGIALLLIAGGIALVSRAPRGRYAR